MAMEMCSGALQRLLWKRKRNGELTSADAVFIAVSLLQCSVHTVGATSVLQQHCDVSLNK